MRIRTAHSIDPREGVGTLPGTAAQDPSVSLATIIDEREWWMPLGVERAWLPAADFGGEFRAPTAVAGTYDEGALLFEAFA